MLLASGCSPLFTEPIAVVLYQLMSDLPEYSTLAGTSEITLRLPGTGASSTYANTTASASVK